jgi:hypothetical protein
LSGSGDELSKKIYASYEQFTQVDVSLQSIDDRSVLRLGEGREIDSSMELFGIVGAAGLTTIERWPREAVRRRSC